MIVQQEKKFLQLTSENESDERCLEEISEQIGEKANLALHSSPLIRDGEFYLTVRIEMLSTPLPDPCFKEACVKEGEDGQLRLDKGEERKREKREVRLMRKIRGLFLPLREEWSREETRKWFTFWGVVAAGYAFILWWIAMLLIKGW